MAKKKIRGMGEYNIPKSWDVHKDAVDSVDRMAKKWSGYYMRKHLVTFGILLLERELLRKGANPGDDIEDILGIKASKNEV